MKTMRISSKTTCLTALLCAVFAGAAQAQGSAFTYQGQLTDDGQPANGTYEMVFNLYSAPTNGSWLASYSLLSGYTVSNGLFTAQLDFGTNVFNGQPLWLQIEVKAPTNTLWTVLSPRQPLTSTPYAIRALTVDASGLRGTIP